jgi:hypothetical protein
LVRSDPSGDVIVGTANFTADTLSGGFRLKVDRQGHGEINSRANSETYFQKLLLVSPPVPGEPDQMIFSGVEAIPCGPYADYADPVEREVLLNIRPVIVIAIARDPITGEILIQTFGDYRAADLPSGGETVTVLWDEVLRGPGNEIVGSRRRYVRCGN